VSSPVGHHLSGELTAINGNQDFHACSSSCSIGECFYLIMAPPY